MDLLYGYPYTQRVARDPPVQSPGPEYDELGFALLRNKLAKLATKAGIGPEIKWKGNRAARAQEAADG